MFLLNSSAFKLCAEFVAGLKSLHIKTMIIQMQHKIRKHPSDPLPQLKKTHTTTNNPKQITTQKNNPEIKLMTLYDIQTHAC